MQVCSRQLIDRLKFLMPKSLIITFLDKCLIILISRLYQVQLLHLHGKNNFAELINLKI